MPIHQTETWPKGVEGYPTCYMYYCLAIAEQFVGHTHSSYFKSSYSSIPLIKGSDQTVPPASTSIACERLFMHGAFLHKPELP